MTATRPRQLQSNPLGLIAGHDLIGTEYENLNRLKLSRNRADARYQSFGSDHVSAETPPPRFVRHSNESIAIP